MTFQSEDERKLWIDVLLRAIEAKDVHARSTATAAVLSYRELVAAPVRHSSAEQHAERGRVTLLSVCNDTEPARVELLVADPCTAQDVGHVAERDPLVFVTVARGEDSEDDERVALVSLTELAKVVAELAHQDVIDELVEADRRVAVLKRELRLTQRALAEAARSSRSDETEPLLDVVRAAMIEAHPSGPAGAVASKLGLDHDAAGLQLAAVLCEAASR